jgi:predicted lipoprotein with Yx(FWY)xxD motif
MRTRTRTLGILAAATVMLLAAACGGDDDAKTTQQPSAKPTPAPAASADAVVVRSATTDLGKILVGKNGMTLYGFTNDTDGTSTCTGTCASAWPPVLVSADWTVGPGLDNGVFSTIRRPDGSEQLVAGKWPLYYYSGDSKPGDTLGQGSGDVWFVVGTDTKLIKTPASGGAGNKAASSTSVQVADSPLGKVLVDGQGRTLYGFTNDSAGTPTCGGDCASTWPAHTITGNPVVGSGLDSKLFTLVDSPAGGKQLKAGKWPLYRFSGDSKPGDVNGQGSGGVWFVVKPDGKLNKATASATSQSNSSGQTTQTTSGY